jgi:PhoPQ-activated pathogenicity-related protein
LLWLSPGLAHRANADLAAYLKKPEPAYKWEKRSETAFNGGTVTDLHMVSQVWQGIPWEHRIQIFRPEKIEHPEFCVLLNTGGSGSDAEMQIGMTAARSCGTIFAILYNIPNQPLYGGKTEDALVVYTWQKYLETGDDTWPLHFPMAKSVIKAMDAIQAVTREQKQTPITSFLITGASKRGWTTWLAGASRDPRIKAIAPMVIDTLNLLAQIPHQLAAYGKPSEQVEDYTDAGMMTKLNTPVGRRLVALEDPYSYRDHLTMPKLIILGTNDRYWAQDALNIYWDGLKGPKWILYTPNTGHNLLGGDFTRVLNTLAAFAHAVASHEKWPTMQWDYTGTSGDATLTLHSDIAPQSARLFHTSAPTQDFRDSKWTSDPMIEMNGSFTGSLETPPEGYAAIFGEATYEIGGKTFTLSTQIKILGNKK